MSTYHLNSAQQVPALRVAEVGILQLGLPHLLKQSWPLSCGEEPCWIKKVHHAMKGH